MQSNTIYQVFALALCLLAAGANGQRPGHRPAPGQPGSPTRPVSPHLAAPLYYAPYHAHHASPARPNYRWPVALQVRPALARPAALRPGLWARATGRNTTTQLPARSASPQPLPGPTLAPPPAPLAAPSAGPAPVNVTSAPANNNPTTPIV